jgi:hypothetical protein
MSGCVQNLQDMRPEAQSVTLFQKLIHIHNARREEAQPFRLHGQVLVERQIARIHHDRGSRGAFQFLKATCLGRKRQNGSRTPAISVEMSNLKVQTASESPPPVAAVQIMRDYYALH